MSQPHSKQEILMLMDDADCAAVSTVAGANIRSRTMHYWNDSNFNIYLSTMKGDPKTLEITENPSVSLLILKRKGDVNDSKEIEITGRAFFVKDKAEKDKAFQALAQKSPVVKYLKDTNNLALLDCIKVVPVQVKYRVFREIVQGNPPTVFEFPENKASVNELQLLKQKIKHWRMEVRGAFLTATVVSIILGTTIAWIRNSVFDFGYFLLAMVGAVFLHLGTNVINDYFDYKSGNDEVNREFIRPFSGGSRVIQLGLLTPLEVLSGALLFYVLGASIGFYLARTRGWMVLFLGLIGIASGFFYTSPPISWASLGVGETVVGINFGVLMTLGAYYVQTRMLALEPLVASLPVASLIAAVLYINEFPDYNADKAVGKRTLVVRLGREKAAYGYVMLMSATYGFILTGVLVGLLPMSALVGLATLPLAVKAVQYAFAHHSNPTELAPANALTIQCHLLTSLLLSVGYAVEWFGLVSIGYFTLIFICSLLLSLYFYAQVEKQKKVLLGLKKTVYT